MAAVVSYMAKLLRLQRSDLLRFATSIAAYVVDRGAAEITVSRESSAVLTGHGRPARTTQ